MINHDIYKGVFCVSDDLPENSYPLLQVSIGTIPTEKVTEVMLTVGSINIPFNTYIGLPYISAEDEMIAFAMLKTEQLLITRQSRRSEQTGSIMLKYPNLDIEEVECCYLFARSRDGKKASNSVYVEVNG